MLTPRQQKQALADRIAGLPTQAVTADFKPPWSSLWEALEAACPVEPPQVLAIWAGSQPDGSRLVVEILACRPGETPGMPADLEDLRLTARPVSWLWPHWLPRGALAMLGAAPGAGKTLLALDLCRRLVKGEPFPDGQPHPGGPCRVLYVDAELYKENLIHRTRHWAIPHRTFFIHSPPDGDMIDFCRPQDREALVEAVAAVRPHLVVVDSFSMIVSCGENKIEEVRPILYYLHTLASYFETCVLVIHHLRKSGPFQASNWDITLDDIRGTGHLLAMNRAILLLSLIQTGPDREAEPVRKLKVEKMNEGPKVKPLGFEIVSQEPEGACLHWTAAPERYHAPNRQDHCREWLLAELRQAPGPLKPARLVELAEQAGYSRTLLYQARSALGARVGDTRPAYHPENEWRYVREDLAGPDGEEP